MWERDQLTVALNAPATEGRANAELVRTLAKFFGVAKGRVRIERGAAARHKVVSVDLDPERVRACLARIAPPIQDPLL